MYGLPRILAAVRGGFPHAERDGYSSNNRDGDSLMVSRRTFLSAVASVGMGSCVNPLRAFQVDRSRPTEFQIACMTLPYASFPWERALRGIKEAGYRYVAWGTKH